MPFVEELWNNTNSTYKNWHKKIKWFSIFIKPNKCQKNRKENKNREKLTWVTCGLALCSQPGPAAQQAGPADWHCQSSPSSCQEDRGTRSPRASTRRPPPASPLAAGGPR